MNRFYIINSRPQLDYGVDDKATIYHTKQAAFYDRDQMMKLCGDVKLKVYEVTIFSSMLCEGWSFREMFMEEDKK